MRLQRKEQVLKKRLKVPPSINQFSQTVDKATATQLFKLLQKYKPEDRAQKKARLRKLAEEKATNDTATVGSKPLVIKFGLNHVTALIEQRKARLVVIAHDVEPIEVSNSFVFSHPLPLPSNLVLLPLLHLLPLHNGCFGIRVGLLPSLLLLLLWLLLLLLLWFVLAVSLAPCFFLAGARRVGHGLCLSAQSFNPSVPCSTSCMSLCFSLPPLSILVSFVFWLHWLLPRAHMLPLYLSMFLAFAFDWFRLFLVSSCSYHLPFT